MGRGEVGQEMDEPGQGEMGQEMDEPGQMGWERWVRRTAKGGMR